MREASPPRLCLFVKWRAEKQEALLVHAVVASIISHQTSFSLPDVHTYSFMNGYDTTLYELVNSKRVSFESFSHWQRLVHTIVKTPLPVEDDDAGSEDDGDADETTEESIDLHAGEDGDAKAVQTVHSQLRARFERLMEEHPWYHLLEIAVVQFSSLLRKAGLCSTVGRLSVCFCAADYSYTKTYDRLPVAGQPNWKVQLRTGSLLEEYWLATSQAERIVARCR